MLKFKKRITEKNVVDNLIMYEVEVLNEEQTIELFAYLVKTGKAWKLPGHYSRFANYLIEQGTISKGGEIL